MSRKDNKGRVLRTGESEYKDGYRFRKKMENGKTVQFYANTLDDLRKQEALFQKEELTYSHMGFTRTLGDQIERYLKTKRSLKKSTLNCYRQWFDGIKNDWLFTMRINKIKTGDVKLWLSEQAESGKSQSTLNGYFTALIKPALSLAVEDEDIRKNPADFKMTDVVKKDTEEKRPLTEEEQKIMIRYLHENESKCLELKAPVILALKTGLRISEVCGLRVSDIDFEQNVIYVRQQIVNIRTPKGTNLHVESLKSKKSERTIPISDETKDLLSEVVEKMKPCRPVDGYSGFLFLDKKNNPINREQIRARYYLLTRKIDEEYGTNLKETTFHQLRHTFCSNLIEAGVNVKVVQYLMGHKSSTTTLDTYTHISNKFVKLEMEKNRNQF